MLQLLSLKIEKLEKLLQLKDVKIRALNLKLAGRGGSMIFEV